MQIIGLRPLGNINPATLEDLAAPLTQRFARPVLVGPSLAVPLHAYDADRQQYLAADVRAALQAARHADEQHIVGICDTDLYAPHLNFVFGEASRSQHNAVVSLARLHTDDPAIFARRRLTEVVHELGHSFGLSHCPNRRCVMHFSVRLEDTDHKGPDFCPTCKLKIS